MGVVVYSETVPHTSHAEIGDDTSLIGSSVSYFSGMPSHYKTGSSRQHFIMANILQNRCTVVDASCDG